MKRVFVHEGIKVKLLYNGSAVIWKARARGQSLHGRVEIHDDVEADNSEEVLKHFLDIAKQEAQVAIDALFAV